MLRRLPGAQLLLPEGVLGLRSRDDFRLNWDVERLPMPRGQERTGTEWRAMLTRRAGCACCASSRRDLGAIIEAEFA